MATQRRALSLVASLLAASIVFAAKTSDDNRFESQSSTDALTADGSEVITKGQINFHLTLGKMKFQDQLILDGDTYTDLIISNFIAGVMQGHLINTYYPGIPFNKDYMYGSIMGQLLQENLASQMYKPGQDLISPAPEQSPVMGAGQGGPYQINNYAVDMVAGTFKPGGYAMINFVTLQKNIGFTMADAEKQNTKVTPPSFNNKYYSPIVTAYFHYVDLVAIIVTGKGEGGWKTPWQPDLDNALVHFKTLPNNFLDVILNVAYNQGFYGGLMAKYCKQSTTATEATVKTVRSYSTIWGKNNTYEQYPYQVMYYLDQMYGNPIPGSSPSDMVTPQNHIVFKMPLMAEIFTKIFQTLGHVNSAGKYEFIPSDQSNGAFAEGLKAAGVAPGASLDLSNASERAKIFNVIEVAIATLESKLGTKFNATTLVQL